MSARAYSAKRRGFKRAVCSACGKRGLGAWRVIPGMSMRVCRYCAHHETRKTNA